MLFVFCVADYHFYSFFTALPFCLIPPYLLPSFMDLKLWNFKKLRCHIFKAKCGSKISHFFLDLNNNKIKAYTYFYK